MSACFDVIDGGMGNTIQDEGRYGFRHQGVPVSGWLDAHMAHAANALVGNPLHAACLEIRGLGPKLQLRQGQTRVALAGDITATLTRASGLRQVLAPWCAFTMQAGDTLHIGAANDGCAYLASASGWQVQASMGSAATYARVGLGGIHGRALQNGDTLSNGDSGAQHHEPSKKALQAWTYADEPMRVMLGPQSDHFTPEALETLFSSNWQTTRAQDRMGVRLSGPRLAHIHAQASDIVSDGIAPGAIQVPGDGQPIVLLADCQTMGGYPKIATVISADLPRWAHLPPERVVRFVEVDAHEAHQALLAQQQLWHAWLTQIRPYAEAGWLDVDALNQSNLIDGMIHALDPSQWSKA